MTLHKKNSLEQALCKGMDLADLITWAVRQTEAQVTDNPPRYTICYKVFQNSSAGEQEPCSSGLNYPTASSSP
tara:strand:- start:7 stop:225 length:219 start_codon:yes stop_codon:yes gene_type:complete